MTIQLWGTIHRWNYRRRVAHQGLHQFSDGALHFALLLAVLAVAALATVELASVGVAAWRLEPVVVHGKSQQLPLPSQPAPLVPLR